MFSKILALYIIVAVIAFSASVVFFQQQETENKIQVQKEKFNEIDWSNEATRVLPREGELGKEWTLRWSDSTQEFSQAESPIIIRKTIAGNEIVSTSYSYSHNEHGTYLILISKGELISNWSPREAVESIFLQTDAKIEKIVDTIPNCVIAYYDYYGDEKETKNDLLLSECAKEDFRVRINLIEGEYKQESIETIVFLSNLIMNKI